MFWLILLALHFLLYTIVVSKKCKIVTIQFAFLHPVIFNHGFDNLPQLGKFTDEEWENIIENIRNPDTSDFTNANGKGNLINS